MTAMTQVAGPRQRAAETKRARTHAAIMKAASQLVETQDWHSIRMEDIAAAAGVSVATLYNYYKGKDWLVIDVYRALIVLHVEHLETLGDESVGAEVLAWLERQINQLAEVACTNRRLTAAYLQTLIAWPGQADELMKQPVSFGALGLVIYLGSTKGVFEVPGGSPKDIANYHLSALLMLAVTAPQKSAEQLAELVLSQLLPVLKPADS